MTTQDIYAWTQIILLVVVGGGLAWYIGLLKRAVDAQKATIDAQAEQLKAQSTGLQDFERLNRTMRLVLDTVSDPAALQREQAFKERLERETDACIEQQAKQLIEKSNQTIAQLRQAYAQVIKDCARLVGSILPFLYPSLRRAIIAASDLPPYVKQVLEDVEPTAPYIPIIDEPSLEQHRRNHFSDFHGQRAP
jgi:multidrug efflux pump subunit AcrA (membrane-fusion protein)